MAESSTAALASPVIAEEPEPCLSRHELDDLYTTTLDAGMRVPIVVLTGTRSESLIAGAFYRRLAHDLHELGTRMVVDLVGKQLDAALASGVELVKISGDDLVGGPEPSEASADRLVEAWSSAFLEPEAVVFLFSAVSAAGDLRQRAWRNPDPCGRTSGTLIRPA
jgi:1-phosphofructokinase